jgi:DNA-directed RNA polymerase specialized sigma24 family protein
VSLQFEVYCKRTLLRELADIAKEVKRRKRRKYGKDETPMSSLDKADARKLERLSHAQEATLFYVAGYEIPIKSDRLADGLLRLTERQRQMVLLSEYCGEPDVKIGERMGVKRSTVQSQRKEALSELRERLER